MAVTVNKVEHSTLMCQDCRIEGTKAHRLTAPLVVNMECTRNGKFVNIRMRFDIGFACDGLSVPWGLRWFLKNWDDSNELYNIAGICHDALYGNKGFAQLTRSECDDIFRGLLRESGKDRKHASMADWAVGCFASSHWGDDSLYSAHMAHMDLIA